MKQAPAKAEAKPNHETTKREPVFSVFEALCGFGYPASRRRHRRGARAIESTKPSEQHAP